MKRRGSTLAKALGDTGGTQPMISLTMIVAASGAELVPDEPWAVLIQRC
jgi:hypothetical protein